MKRIVILLITAITGFETAAQDSHTSNTDRKWFYPDHMVVQFAGNIGMLSVGPGYSYLKDKVRTDILYGFVPGFEETTSIHILTAKTSYHPFNITLFDDYAFQPLRIGTGVSYSVGQQFYTTLPKKYPDAYYWWASSLRLTPFIGASVSRKAGSDAALVKRVELYTELGTTDLDIVNKIGNKSLSYWDIINIAFGSKLVF